MIPDNMMNKAIENFKKSAREPLSPRPPCDCGAEVTLFNSFSDEEQCEVCFEKDARECVKKASKLGINYHEIED